MSEFNFLKKKKTRGGGGSKGGLAKDQTCSGYFCLGPFPNRNHWEHPLPVTALNGIKFGMKLRGEDAAGPKLLKFFLQNGLG